MRNLRSYVCFIAFLGPFACQAQFSSTQEEMNQLSALQSGSTVASKFFYDRYSPQLYRNLLKMVHIQEIAEELLQDLFLKAWKKKESIDPEQSFQGYLYRIAEHMVYDHYRKATR